MLIVDVSGLTSTEEIQKRRIRKKIRSYFAGLLSISESATTVTFITDETINEEEAIIARVYSNFFVAIDDGKELKQICNSILDILSEAGHLFGEVLLVHTIMIRVRKKKKLQKELPCDGHNFRDGVEQGPRDPKL